jgi:cytochrome P450
VKTGVDSYMGYMCEQTMAMYEQVLLPKDGQELDVQELFHMLALRIFGKFSCGHEYADDPDAKWINHAVSDGSHIIGEHIVLGLPVWGAIPRIRRLKESVAKMHRHIEGLIQNRLKLRQDSAFVEPDDPLKGMLDENLSRKDMYEQITTLLSAGHDTTAFFACYMAYMLAEHPEVQQKLKKEVKAVLKGREECTPEDLKEMPYLGNVMKEVLRMFTVIPFVNRTATTDVTLRDGGVFLPKGTVTLLPLFLMNRDPDVWENPNEFNPDRFNDLKIFDSSAKMGYLPFAYGSRTCIGNTLALTEGQVMFALLMQKCTFHSAMDGKFKPQITAGISLVSKNGIRVKVSID